MAEMILPGVFIEVRPEGLIIPERVSVGNLGVVGTAARGSINQPVIIGSYSEARERFGDYDAWQGGGQNELTLVRALEQAYAHGASTVFAVRISATNAGGDPTAQAAAYPLQSASGDNVTLTANTAGTWGNTLEVNVWNAAEDVFVQDEKPTRDAGPPVTLTLAHTPLVKNPRTRVSVRQAASGVTTSLTVIYDDTAAAPAAGQVKINRASGELSFADVPAADDQVSVSYVVAKDQAVTVTLRLDRATELYTVLSGADLVAQINQDPGGSAWVTAATATNSGELPTKSDSDRNFAEFSGGSNGAAAGANNYKAGLETILNEPAHIIVAAGQADDFGDELDAHCQVASSDANKRDRIAVVGSALGASIDDLRSHNLASDRVIFAAPGIKTTDAVSGDEVTLPGAYTAAAVAGLLAGFSAHISPTNKTLRVGGVQHKYTSAQLSQLLQNRILAVEERQGFRIVRGITTATNTAWKQITTRRIVDFAKFGVRSAANPYIGLLNNERVRGAMRATINSFLTEMVNDEMLISYQLDVSATRDEERNGIARVTIVLRPVFSIDFIKVTMFLE